VFFWREIYRIENAALLRFAIADRKLPTPPTDPKLQQSIIIRWPSACHHEQPTDSETQLSAAIVGRSMRTAPACCRHGLAAAMQRNIFVPMATSHDVIATRGRTARGRAISSMIPRHAVEGRRPGTRAARGGEEAFVRRHLGGFAAELNTLGYPRRVTNAVAHWPAFAIEMR
jgi:hypothetical protein